MSPLVTRTTLLPSLRFFSRSLKPMRTSKLLTPSWTRGVSTISAVSGRVTLDVPALVTDSSLPPSSVNDTRTLIV